MTQDSAADRVLGLVHGQVCYLQLPAANRERAARFYEAVFGWQIEAYYPDFEAPGLIGQWVEGRPAARDAGPMIWIHVADMAETLEQVTKHGGEILEPPPRWPDPHPRHGHRPGRQPHRPGRPRAAALTAPSAPKAAALTAAPPGPSRPDQAPPRRLAWLEDSASGGTGAGK